MQLTGINKQGLTEGQVKAIESIDTWKTTTKEQDNKIEYDEYQKTLKRRERVKKHTLKPLKHMYLSSGLKILKSELTEEMIDREVEFGFNNK